jgi:hypothetical protein
MVKGSKKLSSKFDRCVKKVMKKKGVNPFAICKTIFLEVFRTTKFNGHRHDWRVGNKFTSKDAGHKHRVVGRIAKPFKVGSHSHKIIRGR